MTQTQNGTKGNGHPLMGIHYILHCGHHKFISRASQVYKGRTRCPRGCGNVRFARPAQADGPERPPSLE
jgi:hypothetical protein